MHNKISTILKNWLTFMDLEKESKLRIEKGTNSKSKIVNEQYINFHQCSASSNFIDIQLNHKQYNTFINISKYFKFLTLSIEDKEIFLKNDVIDDKIYFSCLLLSSKYEDTNFKDARYFYPIISIPMKVFKLNGMSLKINSVNDINEYIIFKNFLVDKLSIDEDSILDGENIIEFLSKLVNTNLRDKNFLEAIEIVTKWIENRLVEVDSPFTVHKTANLPDFFVSQLDAEDYTKTIYNDLKHKQENKNNALEFVSKHPLACSYLFDIPLGNTNQPKEQIYKGVFGEYPLALGQSIVMQQVQNEELMTAVQGAPGTGKTTLLLSMIANRITKRALALIKNEDFDNLMLITSTSNKAVDNVSDAFLKDFSDYSWLYFIWGNDNKRNKSFNRLQQTISKLKNDNEVYNSIYTEKLVSEIISISEDIDNSLKTYQLLKQKIEDTQKIIQKLKNDIEIFNNDILSKRQLIDSLKNFITEDYSKLLKTDNYKDSLFYNKFDASIGNFNNIQLDDEILKKIEFYEQNYMKFNKLATEFYIDEITENQELFDSLCKHTINTISSINESSFLITIKNIFGRKNSIIRSFISSNRDFIQKCFVGFTIDNADDILRIPGKIEYFNNNISKIKSNLEGYKAFDLSKNAFIQFEKIYNKRVNEINSALKKIENLEKGLQPLSNKLLENDEILLNATIAMETGYKDGFLTYFKNEYHQKNLQLFELSLEYIWQIALRDKTKIIKSLEEWQYSMTTFGGDRKSEFMNNLENHKKNISLVYPVVTTTIASSMSLFFPPKPDIYDYLIVDEAGMITPNLLFPLISISKKSIVVGDPKQLEPIVTLSDKEKESYKEKQWKYIESSDDKRYIEYQKYSPTMSTAYHRAAKCQTVEFDDIGDGIILNEHRRCLADIAKIFIDIAKYNPLKIETSELQPNDKHHFAYNNFGNKSLYSYDVQIDNMTDNVNFEEIDEIDKVLDLLEEAGFDLKNDVGIITPYRNQASKIVSKFKNKINHSRKLEKIGTVHKFQGAEFPVVILSTTVGKNDSITFINSKPNMLNVAVSRAKFIFIVVGNVELLKKGTYSKKMIEHIGS